jgi:hypothetical protein
MERRRKPAARAGKAGEKVMHRGPLLSGLRRVPELPSPGSCGGAGRSLPAERTTTVTRPVCWVLFIRSWSLTPLCGAFK